MEVQAILKRYYSHLIALERRAPLTAQTYRFEIRRFLLWLEEKGLTLDGSAQFSDIPAYLDKRITIDGIDSRSAAKAVSALKSFFRFLAEERFFKEDGVTIADRISLLEAPTRHKRLPEVLKKGEVDKLLGLINTRTPLGIRDRAIYELIYSAGLRISELVSLDLHDIILNERVARLKGKGDKERLVVYGPEAASSLKRYLDEARPLLLENRRSQAFFVSNRGKRLSRKGVWKNYRSLAIQAGISSRVHTLRHTFATDLLSGGADLRSVQELLGHADLVTTQIYTHVDSSFLREKHKQYLPKLKGWKEYD